MAGSGLRREQASPLLSFEKEHLHVSRDTCQCHPARIASLRSVVHQSVDPRFKHALVIAFALGFGLFCKTGGRPSPVPSGAARSFFEPLQI